MSTYEMLPYNSYAVQDEFGQYKRLNTLNGNQIMNSSSHTYQRKVPVPRLNVNDFKKQRQSPFKL